MLAIADIIGYLGSVIIISTYALKTLNRLGEVDYSKWNVIGGFFMIIPAVYHQALPNAITAFFWAVISVILVLKSQNKG